MVLPDFWNDYSDTATARKIRLATIKNLFEQDLLTEADALAILAGPLTPGDDTTICDDSQWLLVDFSDAPPTGIDLIVAERQRQIEQEHYTAVHDEIHEDGALAMAAACYALNPDGNGDARFNFDELIATLWPWDIVTWKPKDRVRDLVRAGALIAAEIDRLKRRADKG